MKKFNLRTSYNRFKEEPFMLYEFHNYEELELIDKKNYGFEKLSTFNHQKFNCHILYKKIQSRKNSKNGLQYLLQFSVTKFINKEWEFMINGLKKYLYDKEAIELEIKKQPYASDINKKVYDNEYEVKFNIQISIHDVDMTYDPDYVEYLGLMFRSYLEIEIFPNFDNYQNKDEICFDFVNSKK